MKNGRHAFARRPLYTSIEYALLCHFHPAVEPEYQTAVVVDGHCLDRGQPKFFIEPLQDAVPLMDLEHEGADHLRFLLPLVPDLLQPLRLRSFLIVLLDIAVVLLHEIFLIHGTARVLIEKFLVQFRDDLTLPQVLFDLSIDLVRSIELLEQVTAGP